MFYTMIKRSYDAGHPSYTNEGIKIFVKVNYISEGQYEEITGVPYTA